MDKNIKLKKLVISDISLFDVNIFANKVKNHTKNLKMEYSFILRMLTKSGRIDRKMLLTLQSLYSNFDNFLLKLIYDLENK